MLLHHFVYCVENELNQEREGSEALINLALFTCVPSILKIKKSPISFYLFLHTHHIPWLAFWMHIDTENQICQICSLIKSQLFHHRSRSECCTVTCRSDPKQHFTVFRLLSTHLSLRRPCVQVNYQLLSLFSAEDINLQRWDLLVFFYHIWAAFCKNYNSVSAVFLKLSNSLKNWKDCCCWNPKSINSKSVRHWRES